MKFSVMSRNAKPTARPTTAERPRIDRTAWVSFRAASASTCPPITRNVLMSDPTTDRSNVLWMNGASNVSECSPNSRARLAESRNHQPATDQEPLAAEIMEQCAGLLGAELPGCHDLFVCLHLVHDHTYAFNPRDHVRDLIARVIIVDPSLQVHHALVNGDAHLADARILGQKLREKLLDGVVGDAFLHLDRTLRCDDRLFLGGSVAAPAGGTGSGRPGICA